MPQQIPDTSFALSTSNLNAMMEYVPDLMPFHIDYNGPAPVSTYMKVEVEKRGVGMPDNVPENGGGGDKRKEEEGRYVSTFRGRVMHGLDVGLPSGYSGLVLRSESGSSLSKEEESKGEEKAKGRRSDSDDSDEVKGTTLLVGSGMYSTVRVWQVDNAVDGGRDEYIRSLREWVGLGSEMHREE